jgi:hypothetical protein
MFRYLIVLYKMYMVGLPVCNLLKFQKNQTECNKSGEQIVFFFPICIFEHVHSKLVKNEKVVMGSLVEKPAETQSSIGWLAI